MVLALSWRAFWMAWMHEARWEAQQCSVLHNSHNPCCGKPV